MPATLTTVSAITKEVYEGKIQSQLQDEAVAYKRITRTSRGVTSEVGGKYVTFPIRVKRNSGIGYRNELEQLPPGGQQGYASVRVPLKYGYGRVRLSGQLIKLASKNYQAFASAMDEEMGGLKTDIQKDVNRIVYGDGTGTLATTGAAGPVNTITVNSVQYLEVGMQIDVGTAAQLLAATPAAANRQITAINASTKAVTFDGAAATISASSLVVRYGNYLREPNGFSSIINNTGTLFNVDPTVEGKWAAIVDANAGVNRALSEGMLITDTDLVRINGGKTSLILMSLGVRRAYFNLLSQQRRYTDTKEFAGGLTGLAFNNGREIPVVEDPDAPPNTIWGLDEDKFKIYQDQEWGWMDTDGTIWKWVHDYDAYEAILSKYWEMGINQRNAHFVIRDVTEG